MRSPLALLLAVCGLAVLVFAGCTGLVWLITAWTPDIRSAVGTGAGLTAGAVIAAWGGILIDRTKRPTAPDAPLPAVACPAPGGLAELSDDRAIAAVAAPGPAVSNAPLPAVACLAPGALADDRAVAVAAVIAAVAADPRPVSAPEVPRQLPEPPAAAGLPDLGGPGTHFRGLARGPCRQARPGPRRPKSRPHSDRRRGAAPE